ncbi:hypothetical protein jhhlp_007005 [Lomentospora prolificans]|uniref:Uncharacterized protein n=1 Tax=Lomentospora prolificans TaxID=41688 RepID=A0A2N3N1F3_9PEZI|nr:hypothetical protein jhhlp_007005 [Lomentospora prolificans]
MASQQPQLKSGVDLQLQSAFSEGNWSVVVRLADKRARTSKDQYYEIVKIAAEAQLGAPVEKSSVVSYVQKLLKDGAAVKDVEGLELLEWACHDIMPESFFQEAIGPLRVRLVKLAPKDKVTAIDCLESCLLHWDLSSAQQIAALLDRTFPGEHRFLFWNIVITYLFSLSDQCPADKQRLYRELSIKQIQKAAQLSEQALETKEKEKPARGIQSEEEILLLFEMLASRGDVSHVKEALNGPLLNPIKELHLGRKEVLLRSLDFLKEAKEWPLVYQFARDAVSVKEDVDGQREPSLLACDWRIWQFLVEAATHVMQCDIQYVLSTKSVELKLIGSRVVEHVRTLLQERAPDKQKPVYARTLSLAAVLIAFAFGDIGRPAMTLKPSESRRVLELLDFIDKQHRSPACFDDIRCFVEKLSTPELKYVAYERLPQIAQDAEGYKSVAIKVLTYKIRYLITTTPQGNALRKDLDGEILDTTEVAHDALRLYRSLEDIELGDKSLECARQDFLPELTVLAAVCLLDRGGFGARDLAGNSSNRAINYRDVLVAAMLLEHQLEKTPKHSGILFLLVRIYLITGCAHRAGEVWGNLDVKRTIVDSLGPIFFDRISGIAPDVAAGSLLSSSVQSHYLNSLRLRMPRRLADAFDSESYSSILQIPEHTRKLRTSCTMVMGYVEELRGQRALGTRRGEGLNSFLLTEITNETELSVTVDYGSFPRLGSSLQAPLHESLSIGPDLSNNRSHLALLAEQYFSLFNFKAPPAYKPANPALASAAEHTLIIESLSRLSNSFNRFLRGSKTELLPSERIYYNLLSVLSSLTLDAVQSARSRPVVEAIPSLVSSVTESLELLLDLAAANQSDADPPSGILGTLSSLIPISYVRDAATAVRAVTAYIQAYHERQTARDRSGESSLRKEVLADVKKLDTAGKDALKEAQGWIVSSRNGVSKPGFAHQLARFITETPDEAANEKLEDAIKKVIRRDGEGEVNIWAKKVVDGWRLNLDGWMQVKWE